MRQSFKQQFSSGFSLLELMIVILIIGIITSLSILQIDTADDRLKVEAQRLLALTQLARDDAILGGKHLGMVVQSNSYYFTRYNGDSWLVLKQKPYKTIKLDNDMSLKALVSSKPVPGDKAINNKNEMIYFLATGESSEFQLWINNENNTEFILSGDVTGKLSLKSSL